VVRKVGQFTREVQNTSQSFIREMERAADASDAGHPPSTSAVDLPGAPSYEPFPFEGHPPVGEVLAEPSPALDLHPPSAAEALPHEPAPHADAPVEHTPVVAAVEHAPVVATVEHERAATEPAATIPPPDHAGRV
jgi:hypothetical protein